MAFGPNRLAEDLPNLPPGVLQHLSNRNERADDGFHGADGKLTKTRGTPYAGNGFKQAQNPP
jgi:hypothetical protein